MIKKVAVAVFIIVIASLSVAGCTNQQQTTQSTSSAGASGIEVAVKALQSPNQIGTQAPRPNYKFAVFNCTVNNVNAQGKPVAVNYFSAQDTRGNSYNISGFSLVTVYPSISNFKGSSHSQPGDTFSGTVVFEVPQNAKLVSLTYDDHSVAYHDYRGNATVKLS